MQAARACAVPLAAAGRASRGRCQRRPRIATHCSTQQMDAWGADLSGDPHMNNLLLIFCICRFNNNKYRSGYMKHVTACNEGGRSQLPYTPFYVGGSQAPAVGYMKPECAAPPLLPASPHPADSLSLQDSWRSCATSPPSSTSSPPRRAAALQHPPSPPPRPLPSSRIRFRPLRRAPHPRPIRRSAWPPPSSPPRRSRARRPSARSCRRGRKITCSSSPPSCVRRPPLQRADPAPAFAPRPQPSNPRAAVQTRGAGAPGGRQDPRLARRAVSGHAGARGACRAAPSRGLGLGRKSPPHC